MKPFIMTNDNNGSIIVLAISKELILIIDNSNRMMWTDNVSIDEEKYKFSKWV